MPWPLAEVGRLVASMIRIYLSVDQSEIRQRVFEISEPRVEHIDLKIKMYPLSSITYAVLVAQAGAVQMRGNGATDKTKTTWKSYLYQILKPNAIDACCQAVCRRRTRIAEEQSSRESI